MKKKNIFLLATIIGLVFGLVNLVNASLVTIGTAVYQGSTYKLIYDNDDTGHGGGGLVWLDYTKNYSNRWIYQKAWTITLGQDLSVTLFPTFTTEIDWSTGWRLPDAVDGPYVNGYEGDPDGDGVYSYTYGYNLANSEMGHLFYDELGNIGALNTEGQSNPMPPAPDYFLQNHGDFEHLYANRYWSGTTRAEHSGYAWTFITRNGGQGEYSTGSSHFAFAMAVHPGTVTAVVPLPGAIWLLGTGLLGLIGFAGYPKLRTRKK